MGFLVVFLGGGLGAALRHGVNLASARLLGTGFNYAYAIRKRHRLGGDGPAGRLFRLQGRRPAALGGCS